MPGVPSLDALVVKLLEIGYSKNPNIPHMKNLVAQLPAAAAEVRGIQAGAGRNGPCSCGLDQEVARVQEQLQVYIDNEANNKKGNIRKTIAMENQRLTKAVADQKKEMNGYLSTIQQQKGEIARLRKELQSAQETFSRKERSGAMKPAPQSAMATQGVTGPGKQSRRSTALSVDDLPKRFGIGGGQVPTTAAQKEASATGRKAWTNICDPRLSPQFTPSLLQHQSSDTSKRGFTESTGKGNRTSDSADTVVVKLPPAAQGVLSLINVSVPPVPTSHQLQRVNGKRDASFSKTISAEPTQEDTTRAPVVNLSGIKRKRPAAEDLNPSAPKKARADSGYHVPLEVLAARKPVCQSCRMEGAECDHASRCAECDNRISPFVYVLCKGMECCKDPLCDYLHDDQWEAKASPVWLIQGINTFSDDPALDDVQISKSLEQFCPLENNFWKPEHGSSAVEGYNVGALDYGDAS